MSKRLNLLFISLLTALFSWANSQLLLSPEASISLLTCTPGKELYSAFGHTAIRIADSQRGIDYVFNYGIFDFDVENFYYRFVKGETDYQLGLTTYKYFQRAYEGEGRIVFEQTLELDSAGKQKIFDALWENYRPENRFYRYNFVFDNCATRPYYLIRNNVDGVLVNMQFAERKDTYRQIIAHYTNPNSWMFFGIDFIFGKNADVVMTSEQRMFLPEELMLFLAGAEVYQGDMVNEAVNTQFVGQFISPQVSKWLSPAFFLVVLLFFFVVLSLLHTFRKHYSFFFDSILYLMLGLLGTVAFYLAFFSIHPLVNQNYNLLLINPLFLILFVLTLFKKGRQWLAFLQGPLLVYALAVFVVRMFVPQAHNWLFTFVAIIVSLRAWTYLRIQRGKSLFPVIRRKRLLLFFLGVGTSFVTMAQQPPRLMVCVVVDGLNQDNLQRMQHYFDKGGFRLLQEEATFYEAVTFPQQTFGGDETMATIATGTVPVVHGISASTVFDKNTRKSHPSLEDKHEQGIGTDEKTSPRELKAPTFSDMHRMQWGKDAKIYAVGIQAQPTILLGGHSADAAVWMDTRQCGWATSTYYPYGLPSEAYQMNAEGTFRVRATEEWTPRFPTMGLYLTPSEEEKKVGGFAYRAYTENTKGKTNASLFHMPSANQLVVDLAIRLVQTKELGKDLTPDLLCLQLTTVTPNAHADIFSSAEQEDMYMRLNETMGQLMDALQKHVDPHHLMLVLVGRPIHGMVNTQIQKARIQTGDFDASRAAALINTYLMALYGQERWIDGTHLNQIFLNRPLIEKKKINLSELQRKTADFLMEFEGVKMAYTASEIPLLANDVYGETKALRHSFYRPNGGDVVFTLQPGWNLVDERKKTVDCIAEPHPSVPCFVLTKDRTHSQISQTVTATQIAPFICKALKIPFIGHNNEPISMQLSK